MGIGTDAAIPESGQRIIEELRQEVTGLHESLRQEREENRSLKQRLAEQEQQA